MYKHRNDNCFTLYDLTKSKIRWLTHSDSYGIWEIESICYIYQDYDLVDKLYAIGPMMAAQAYAKSDLFYKPEFKYRAVFGIDYVKFFRTHFPYKKKDTYEKISNKFKELKYYLNVLSSKELTLLNDKNELNKILLTTNKNFISEINFNYKNLGIRIISKVKNINFNDKSNTFQVEIGEVVFPYIFSDSTNQLLEKSTFAYLAFNNFKKVEFILEQVNQKTNYKLFEKKIILDSEIKLWLIN